MDYAHLMQADPELYASMERQRDHLELIASENFTSQAVMEAVGSHLTNKYAEGYPGARYYGGCAYVDEVERLAIERVTRLFGADHANVQPHSGSQANMAVYAAAAAGRPDPRYEPLPRRTSDARQQGVFVREIF